MHPGTTPQQRTLLYVHIWNWSVTYLKSIKLVSDMKVMTGLSESRWYIYEIIWTNCKIRSTIRKKNSQGLSNLDVDPMLKWKFNISVMWVFALKIWWHLKASSMGFGPPVFHESSVDRHVFQRKVRTTQRSYSAPDLRSAKVAGGHY